MLQPTFLNRQALYLRPDPARVIVRPFKPATEPRDLNPTDKTRANHIVDRVLALDAEAVAAKGRTRVRDRPQVVEVVAVTGVGDHNPASILNLLAHQVWLRMKTIIDHGL